VISTQQRLQAREDFKPMNRWSKLSVLVLWPWSESLASRVCEIITHLHGCNLFSWFRWLVFWKKTSTLMIFEGLEACEIPVCDLYRLEIHALFTRFFLQEEFASFFSKYEECMAMSWFYLTAEMLIIILIFFSSFFFGSLTFLSAPMLLSILTRGKRIDSPCQI